MQAGIVIYFIKQHDVWIKARKDALPGCRHMQQPPPPACLRHSV